ncbi:MAG: sigma-70 family RNA polymerase sigma factor [Planctomycetales bacterium]|nr:sigma-70 family RNA polymerase sigma factor [Planctomycetales bacterium]
MNDPSMVLVELFRQGDEAAAGEMFQRYVERLIAVARNRLSAKMKRRVDAEDVVQSAFRSFFAHAQQGRYEIEETGDLWRLLVVITINKLRQKVEYHTAAKRGFNREQSQRMDTSFAFGHEAVDKGPSPDAELAVDEEIEQLTTGMDEVQRRIVELRLQGYGIEEIAEDVGRSERTVRRLMEKVRERLEQRMSESASA